MAEFRNQGVLFRSFDNIIITRYDCLIYDDQGELYFEIRDVPNTNVWYVNLELFKNYTFRYITYMNNTTRDVIRHDLLWENFYMNRFANILIFYLAPNSVAINCHAPLSTSNVSNSEAPKLLGAVDYHDSLNPTLIRRDIIDVPSGGTIQSVTALNSLSWYLSHTVAINVNDTRAYRLFYDGVLVYSRIFEPRTKFQLDRFNVQMEPDGMGGVVATEFPLGDLPSYRKPAPPIEYYLLDAYINFDSGLSSTDYYARITPTDPEFGPPGYFEISTDGYVDFGDYYTEGEYLVEIINLHTTDVVASGLYNVASNLTFTFFVELVVVPRSIGVEILFTDSNVRYDEYELVVTDAETGDPLQSSVLSNSSVSFLDIDYNDVLLVLTHIPTSTLMLSERREINEGWNNFQFTLTPIRRKYLYQMIEDGKTVFREGVGARWQLQDGAYRPLMTDANGKLSSSFLPSIKLPNTKVVGSSAGYIPTNWFVSLRWDLSMQAPVFEEVTSGEQVVVGFNTASVPSEGIMIEAESVGVIQLGYAQFDSTDIGKSVFINADGLLTTTPYIRENGTYAKVGVVLSPSELKLSL